ncbi:MAG TPA: GNAT family N-acetyltransferase [Niastella sp.]
MSTTLRAPAASRPAKHVLSPACSFTELLVGDDVLQLLEDPAFQARWDKLFHICTWATVFQSRSFVATWYRLYGKEFYPILVKREQAGQLTGLITLAVNKNGLITGAGANQAEYQVWLTADANDELFIKSALQEVCRFFPGKRILLHFIPADVSFGYLKKDPIWNKRCFVKEVPHPLMIVNDEHFTNELRKKNRREKLNRLRRLGELTFERISDFDAFNAVFDTMAIQSDFRKGAMYNKTDFTNDALRKKFLLTLFELNSVHVTVLKLDDKIIASNVSIRDKSHLHLQGLNFHAAAFARYSPGIIHFLMLGKLLAEENVAVFDLTPGADAYKEILATDHTVARSLSVGNNYHNVTSRYSAGLHSFIKNTATRAGIQQGTLRKWKRKTDLYRIKLKNIMKQGISSSFAYAWGQLKRQKKTTTCWVVQKEIAGDVSGLLNIQKDNCKDLLGFDPREIRYSLQEFLSNSMYRLEEGEHCYTWAEKGKLLGCAWVTNLKPADYEANYSGKIEGWIISLTGLYCHAEGRKQYADFLKAVAAEVAMDSPHNRFYIVTDSDAHRVFEKCGFQLFELIN